MDHDFCNADGARRLKQRIEEYWRERGRCYGRLLFVGPSGRLWCDPLAAFHGQTQRDVMGQALALSDRLLAYRLREVISG